MCVRGGVLHVIQANGRAPVAGDSGSQAQMNVVEVVIQFLAVLVVVFCVRSEHAPPPVHTQTVAIRITVRVAVQRINPFPSISDVRVEAESLVFYSKHETGLDQRRADADVFVFGLDFVVVSTAI